MQDEITKANKYGKSAAEGGRCSKPIADQAFWSYCQHASKSDKAPVHYCRQMTLAWLDGYYNNVETKA